MTSVLDMTSIELLAIPVDKPERFFDRSTYNHTIRTLIQKWHEDRNDDPHARSVTEHVLRLRKSIKDKIAANTWSGPGEITFIPKNGLTPFKIKYRVVHEFELGKIYVGMKTITYVLNDEFSDLFTNGVDTLGRIKYADDAMKQSFIRFMPKILRAVATNEGHVMVLEKTPEVVLLKDLLDYTSGKFDPRHSAWFGNALFNLTAFLEYNDICFNGFTRDNVWISPEYHSVMLYGGWWYSKKIGTKLSALPAKLLASYPADILDDKMAKASLDRFAVKSLIIETLGDPSGNGIVLLRDPSVPAPMINWLRLPVSNKANKDFRAWDDTLAACFGPKKFVEFAVDLDKIYGNTA